MSKVRRIVVGLVLVGLGCGYESGPSQEGGGALPPSATTITCSGEVAEAFVALEMPSPPRYHPNDPPFSTMINHPQDFYDDCPEAIDFLIKTPSPVEPDLLRLAAADKPLHVRHRAAFVLILRRNLAVIPILQRSCSADTPLERYVSWRAYGEAIENKYLPAPRDWNESLTLYEKETDRKTRDAIKNFFGYSRAREAVPCLLTALRGNPGDTSAIWALGKIGDARAVSPIIDAFAKAHLNQDFHLRALGRLVTPEAVDFLIDHLDICWSAEALAEARSPKAIPALQKRLDELSKSGRQAELDFAMVKVALTQLCYENPAEPLLALAEDRTNSEWLRHHALTGVEACPTDVLHPRLLRLLGDDPDLDVKRFSMRLLAGCSLEGVTEELTRLALACGHAGNVREVAFQHELRLVLNERLGLSCRDLEVLQAQLKKRSNLPIRAD